MSDQITPIIERLRVLCDPTAEALSDRARLDAFVKAGGEAADALERLWLHPESVTEKWARQRAEAIDPNFLHIPTPKSVGVFDVVECSCGWKSNQYFDGQGWAHDEWSNHLASTNAKAST